MICPNCHARVVGAAQVTADGKVFHAHGCLEAFRRAQRGLVHGCPKCMRTGEMDDPSGRTRTERVHTDDPLCGYDGCMGCEGCRTRTKAVQVPVKVTCSLCKGEGWLTEKPEPVTKVVDWKLPRSTGGRNGER